MAKLDLQLKLQKMLRFLTAMNDPRIFTLMARRGFTNAARRRGWELLLAAGGQFVNLTPPEESGGEPAHMLERIDAFENEWYDVIEAALEANFDGMYHQAIFLNLHKTSDERVALTVTTLLDRVDALEKQGEATRPVIDLLAQRGFTKEVRAEGRRLLAQLTDAPVQVLATPDPVAEAVRAKAEADMWCWYREWSKTARTVVRRKDLRIKMGISTATRAEPPEDDDEEPAPPAPGAQPQPPAPAASVPPAGAAALGAPAAAPAVKPETPVGSQRARRGGGG